MSIAAGNQFALAVTDTGSVVAWGHNTFGQSTVPDAAQSGVVKVAAIDSEAAAVESEVRS